MVVRDFSVSDSELVEDELDWPSTVRVGLLDKNHSFQWNKWTLPSVVRRKRGFNTFKYSST